MFYTLRVLLGVAEAGFYPGIILYLTQLVSVAPSSPRCGAVHDGDSDLRDHRRSALWLDHGKFRPRAGGPDGNGCFCWRRFRPSSMGLVVLFYLDDGIQSAKLAPPEERACWQRISIAIARGSRPCVSACGAGRSARLADVRHLLHMRDGAIRAQLLDADADSGRRCARLPQHRPIYGHTVQGNGDHDGDAWDGAPIVTASGAGIPPEP